MAGSPPPSSWPFTCRPPATLTTPAALTVPPWQLAQVVSAAALWWLAVRGRRLVAAAAVGGGAVPGPGGDAAAGGRRVERGAVAVGGAGGLGGGPVALDEGGREGAQVRAGGGREGDVHARCSSGRCCRRCWGGTRCRRPACRPRRRRRGSRGARCVPTRDARRGARVSSGGAAAWFRSAPATLARAAVAVAGGAGEVDRRRPMPFRWLAGLTVRRRCSRCGRSRRWSWPGGCRREAGRGRCRRSRRRRRRARTGRAWSRRSVKLPWQ